MPETRIKDTRVGFVDRDICGASRVVDEESVLPGCPAGLASETSPASAGTERITKGFVIYYVGIFRMDPDPADLTRVFQTATGPCLPGVRRFVPAIAVAKVASDRRFGGSDIDHV